MAECVKLFEVDSNCEIYGYSSAGGSLVILRAEQGSGHWVLYSKGCSVDSDQYRYDLAERNDLKLQHSDGYNCWED